MHRSEQVECWIENGHPDGKTHEYAYLIYLIHIFRWILMYIAFLQIIANDWLWNKLLWILRNSKADFSTAVYSFLLLGNNFYIKPVISLFNEFFLFSSVFSGGLHRHNSKSFSFLHLCKKKKNRLLIFLCIFGLVFETPKESRS